MENEQDNKKNPPKTNWTEFARLGGNAIKEKRGVEYFKELRKKRKNYPKMYQKQVTETE
jgi:hypothetical protein